MKARAALLLLTGWFLFSCGESDVADENKGDSNGSITARGPNGSKVSVDKSGREISVTDEKGNTYTSGAAVTESSLGLPFYPGSSEWLSGSSVAEHDGQVITSVMRKTDDSPERVTAFYRERVANPKVTEENLPEADLYNTTITGTAVNGGEVEILVRKLPGQNTTIGIAVTRPQ